MYRHNGISQILSEIHKSANFYDRVKNRSHYCINVKLMNHDLVQEHPIWSQGNKSNKNVHLMMFSFNQCNRY